jgi:hypothetical protein
VEIDLDRGGEEQEQHRVGASPPDLPRPKGMSRPAEQAADHGSSPTDQWRRWPQGGRLGEVVQRTRGGVSGWAPPVVRRSEAGTG